LTPACAGLLEARGSGLKLLKSTFNEENFTAGCLGLSPAILVKCVSQPEIAKSKVMIMADYDPLFWRSRSFKVIEFGANREPVYDFLLVINSNLHVSPISHRYWDTATYWPKIANFAHSPLI